MWLYEHFELYNPFISVELIVWSVFAGIVVASLLAVYNKRLIGGFVKELLFRECFSPETAKTIVELGYGTDWIIKNALRKDKVLRGFVARAEDGENVDNVNKADNVDNAANGENGENGENEAKDKKKADRSDCEKRQEINFLTARFFIPEEKKYGAEVRYASRGTNLVSLAVGLLICAAAAFAAIVLIPDIIQLIDNFLGTFS